MSKPRTHDENSLRAWAQTSTSLTQGRGDAIITALDELASLRSQLEEAVRLLRTSASEDGSAAIHHPLGAATQFLAKHPSPVLSVQQGEERG